MSNKDTIASFIMKITKLRDQFFAFNTKIKDEDRVTIALNSSPPPWEVFKQAIYVVVHLPNFNFFWDARIQEETRCETMERKVNEAQDLAIIGKMRKGGPKKGMKEQSCYSNHYRKDFRRDMFQGPRKGNFSSKCPQNKVAKHKQKQKRSTGTTATFNNIHSLLSLLEKESTTHGLVSKVQQSQPAQEGFYKFTGQLNTQSQTNKRDR